MYVVCVGVCTHTTIDFFADNMQKHRRKCRSRKDPDHTMNDAIATIADERISGRRIFALVRCKGNFGYFTVRLKNGAWNKTSAISCYFKPSLDTLQDICAEGLLASENVFPAGRYFWVCEYVKGPSVLKELHIQMPPIGRELGVSLKSDLFNQGDMVEISSFGGIGESAVPFESGPVKGLRYGIWEGKRELAYELKDLQKNSCLKGKGSQFTLKNVKEGTYILTVELFLDGTFAMKKDFRIKVQSSPF